MKTLVLLSCLLTISLFAQAAEEKFIWPSVLVERKNANVPVVSVYYAGNGITTEDTPVVCVWADGRAVWSENRRHHSGPPYYAGQVDPKRLKAFFAALRASGLYTRKQWGIVYGGTDNIEATIFDGQHRVELGSIPGAYSSYRRVFKRVVEDGGAAPFLYHQIDSLLPRPGQKLRSFQWEIRRID